MAVLLDRANDLDTMLLTAFENQLGTDICAIDELAGREQSVFGQLTLTAGQVARVRCVRGRGFDICDQVGYAG